MMVAGADVAMVKTEVGGWGEEKGRGAATDRFVLEPLATQNQLADF